jgi:type 1 glutamine amidotransferase
MTKKALCTWGGWDGHTPERSTLIMKQLLEKEGFEVTMVKGLKCLEKMEILEKYNLIVFCHTMSKIKKNQRANLVNAVMGGVGLVGWHGGLCDSFREDVEYQFMTGAQWVSHPGGSGMTYDVNFVSEKKDDPIIKGLQDFKITSEQYFIHVDPSVETLATTTFHSQVMPWIEGIKMPVAFKKRWGDGKVFYASIGHTFKDFEIPTALEMMRRGMLWASEKEGLNIDQNSSLELMKKSF